MSEPKEPVVIDGKFRVVGEAPKREPFWGPNASVSNGLYAAMSGLTLLGHRPTDNPSAGKWRARVVLLAIVLIIAWARGQQGP